MSREKPLHWIGSSKDDFLAFPPEVKSEMGYALGVAQLGGKHPKAKPWRGEARALSKWWKAMTATLIEPSTWSASRMLSLFSMHSGRSRRRVFGPLKRTLSLFILDFGMRAKTMSFIMANRH